MVPASVFQAAFAGAQLGELLLSPAEEPLILAVNDAFLLATGRHRGELVGQPFASFFHTGVSIENSAGAAALGESLRQVIATGQAHSQTVQAYPFQLPSKLPLLSEAHEARYWRFTNTPIFAPVRELLCIVHSAEDVTANWRLQESLRHSAVREAFQLKLADRLRSIESPEDVVATATEMLGQQLGLSRVAYAEVDARQATFLIRSHWTNEGLASITGEIRRLDDFGPEIIALLSAGLAMVVDDVNTDPRTSVHASAYAALHVRANLAIPVLKAGKLTTILSLQQNAPRRWAPSDIELARDVAERTWAAAENARAQQALRDASQRKDEFLAMLAHELRNPLAPISVAAQLLARQQLDPGSLRKTGEVIGRQVKHMTALIDDLLDVSRVTRGLVRIDEAPQELKLIIANAVEQARPLLESQKHQLSLNLPDEPVSVLGDGKRLVQIVTNLINNAAKYTPSGGHVDVSVELRPTDVRMHVCDDGIGISKDLQPRIFDLFAQGERTRDRSQGGLGIGLALVKSLVELHHGTVTCTSEGLNRGSVFTVTLPRLSATRL